MNRKGCFLLVLVVLLSCFSANAWAEDSIFSKNKTVNEGQKVESIFLYGEDGIISGEVAEEVVVINGDLTLTKTARIHDGIFMVGGKLTQEPGAEVRKGIYQISLANEYLKSLLLGVGVFAVIEMIRLFLALFIFLASLASLFVLKNKVSKAKAMLQAKMLKTGLLGLFATIGLGLLFTALIITVWGIPVAILLGLILLMLLPVGLGALSAMIGELLSRSFTWGEKPFYQVLIGSLFIVALLSFPVLGTLWGVLILIFALGALATSLLPKKLDSDA